MSIKPNKLVARLLISQLTVAGLLLNACVPSPAPAQLSQQRDNFDGTIDFSTDKTSTFQLSGTEPSLGEYTAHGEVTFRPGDAKGTLVGEGVAVFVDKDGDRLVAVVNWPLEAEKDGKRAGNAEFRWRDSVEFSDGTVVESSGKFANAEDRPPGLVVIAIIAILLHHFCNCAACEGC